MKFDEITSLLGEFGKYQKILYFLVCLPAIFTGMQMLSSVFTLSIPNHRCDLQTIDNDTYEVQGHWHEILINRSIPLVKDDDDVYAYDDCDMFATNQNTSYNERNNPVNTSKKECNKWVFDKSTFKNTFITQILNRVSPRITKSNKVRPALDPGLKLAITLRFLATGNSYQSLAFDFRVAHNTISLFVPEVCDAIVEEFQDELLVTPSSPEEWLNVSRKFGHRWNFHHACGAIDGKHIYIKKPRKSGSLYFNNKGRFSIVLLGLVDADYMFKWVHVGEKGSSSDCGIFNKSSLEPALREGSLGLPLPDPLPYDDRDTLIL